MKRELKGVCCKAEGINPNAHKANPYEKGTESYYRLHIHLINSAHKANPYEKGTESHS